MTDERESLLLGHIENLERTVFELRYQLDWVRDGLAHFTSDEDRGQAEHLTKAIDACLEKWTCPTATDLKSGQ